MWCNYGIERVSLILILIKLLNSPTFEDNIECQCLLAFKFPFDLALHFALCFSSEKHNKMAQKCLLRTTNPTLLNCFGTLNSLLQSTLCMIRIDGISDNIRSFEI